VRLQPLGHLSGFSTGYRKRFQERMHASMTSFEQFIKERKYLLNVSPATVRWYTHALKWLPSENPSSDELKEMVVRMREQGLKATGANAAIRTINCYLRWRQLPGLRPLQEPEFIPPMFTREQVRILVKWKPTTFYDRRLSLLILLLLDNGSRISEALSVHTKEISLDDLLLTLTSKGRKQRIVPISMELRRAVFKFIRDFDRQPNDLLLSSKSGEVLGRNVCLRDVKRLCRRPGFEPPARTLHAFRHTFAVSYLRHGGGVFHLQKILGHRSLEMTRRDPTRRRFCT
jgi:integrase/recombinase XerD